jgi:hypothetical protein
MKVQTTKKVEVEIKDNELANCLINKVVELLGGYEGYSFTTDKEGNTFVGEKFVSNSPKVAAYVNSANYLYQDGTFEVPPEHIKYKFTGMQDRLKAARSKSNVIKNNTTSNENMIKRTNDPNINMIEIK